MTQTRAFHIAARLQWAVGAFVGLVAIWPLVIVRGVYIGLCAAWQTLAEAEL